MTTKAVIQKTVVDEVMLKIEEVSAHGGIHLPSDYSPQNAIQSAGLLIANATDKDGKPALDVCTKTSIANALLYMVSNGLNPIKKQCYFIVYKDELQCQRSYQGSIALAKRFGDVKEITAQTVFEADEFEFHIDIQTGRKTLLSHKQTLDSIDPKKIKGTYALATLNDGTTELEVMTIAQVKSAWLMRQGKGLTKAHESFGDQMCEKTVINRLCKKFINSSSDNVLMPEENDSDIIDNDKTKGDKPNSKILVINPNDNKELAESNKGYEEQNPEGETEKTTIPKPNF